MLDTITRYLEAVADRAAAYNLKRIFNPIGDRISTQTLASAALRIHGGSASPTVQTNAVSYYSVKGILVTKATATDLAALSGTVTNGTFNAYSFFIDSAGTVTSQMGTSGAALANVSLASIPEGKAMIGFVIINPTGTGDFVGGTTNLDDATVMPNAVFVNTVGAFDPTVLL